jgi:hypothetical protein
MAFLSTRHSRRAVAPPGRKLKAVTQGSRRYKHSGAPPRRHMSWRLMVFLTPVKTREARVA